MQHPSRFLSAIRFHDRLSGLVVGIDLAKHGPLVFVTHDGGQSWIPPQGKPTSGLLSELSEEVGDATYFAGDRGTIVGTDDGGLNWQRLELSGVSETVRGFSFIGNVGWAVGHAGLVARTTDGGGSWQTRQRFTGNRLRSVVFTSIDRGFIAGDQDVEPGAVWLTVDGGASWTRALVGVPDQHRLVMNTGTLWSVGKEGSILSCRVNTAP